MRYIVTGTDLETGQPIELTVEAADVPSAATLVSRKGVTVAGVRAVTTPPPSQIQDTQVPPPVRTQVGTVPPEPPPTKKGARLWLSLVLLLTTFTCPAYPAVPLWAGIVVLALLGLYVLPPFRRPIGRFLRLPSDRPVSRALKLTTFVLIGVSLIGLSVAGRGIAREIQAAEAKRQADAAAKARAEAEASSKLARLIDDANRALDASDVTKAESLLDEALKISAPNRGLAQSLRAKVRNSADLEWVTMKLIAAPDEEFTRFQDGGAPPKDLDLGYAVLTDRAVVLARPQIESVIARREEAKRKAEVVAEEQRKQQIAAVEAAKAKAAAEAEARNKAARRELIEKQFSVWDGSHRNLTKKITDAMNDPDSYQHVETKYVEFSDYLLVTCSFRGKNKFGGVVKNTVLAKVDLNGNVIEMTNLGE